MKEVCGRFIWESKQGADTEVSPTTMIFFADELVCKFRHCEKIDMRSFLDLVRRFRCIFLRLI